MSTRLFDVAVIGAGLGGACAALSLAQRGASVVVLESAQFPRHKVCGEFLSPEIFKTFARLKIEDHIRDAQPVSVTQARIFAPRPSHSRQPRSHPSRSRQLEIELPQAGWGLSRYALDAILWQSLKDAGVDALSQMRVNHITRDDDSFGLHTRSESFKAKFVINAAGRNVRFSRGETLRNEYSLLENRVQRYVGFKAHFRDVKNYDGAVELHAFDGGYCGVGAIEGETTNVCTLAKYETVAGRSPAEFWNWQQAQSASLRARMHGATQLMSWLATGNVSFGRVETVCNGVINCGDAAGYIHPLTGNGMAMAARSGEIAASLIACALHDKISARDVEELYTRSWQREFSSRLSWAARIEPLLVSSRLTSAALAAMRLAPAFSQRLVSNTRGA